MFNRTSPSRRELVLLLAAVSAWLLAPAEGRAQAKGWPRRLDAQHLPNAIGVTEKVLSGGLPEGDEAFAELARLGVQTVISVDAARPNLKLAEKHGLRYVHLPHGYDGIPACRAIELAKAVRELPGPIYLHCHHGKHRSPAAAATACVSAGLLAPEQAVPLLKLAGTSPHYEGLYAAAAAARPLPPAELERVPGHFPALAKPAPMAEAMSLLEQHHDHLLALAKNEWRPLSKHPALKPAHEALLLREHFTELLRGDSPLLKEAEFRRQLEASESTAQQLEDALRAWSKAAEGKPPAAAATALAALTEQCRTCHVAFRDKPKPAAP